MRILLPFFFAFFARLRFNLLLMPKIFIEAVEKHQSSFGLNLTEEQISRLGVYYEFVQKHNEILHLVAPSSPEEFAVRHVLESLTLPEFLPAKARLADVGAGAGLPSIPCLIARDDLRGVLIESKLKKAAFLKELLTGCGLAKRARVFDRQFEEFIIRDISHITCRALDKFAQKLPSILKWSKNRSLLFFGGSALGVALGKQGVKFKRKLMPLSEQRFLFIIEPKKK